MARWRECEECFGRGKTDCPRCFGVGMDLPDEEELLDGVDNEPDVCDNCLGDGTEPCDPCEGTGGWYAE
jgi:DnaJ-class molecular chaperone